MRPETLALGNKPSRGMSGSVGITGGNHEFRLAMLVGPAVRPLRPDLDGQPLAIGADQSRVAVTHVPFRALHRVGQRRLLQLRISGQYTRRGRKVLGPAALRAPATQSMPRSIAISSAARSTPV